MSTTVCAASLAADDHDAKQTADKLQDERIDSFIDEAVEQLLRSDQHDDILYNALVLAGPVSGPRKRRRGVRLFDSAGLPHNIDNEDDWQRALHLCSLRLAPQVLQAYRQWCLGVWKRCDHVRKEAERLAAEDEAQRREDAPLLGVDA